MATKKKKASGSKYLPEVFATDDVELTVTNAFCFSADTVFLHLDASSDDDDVQASALVKVALAGGSATYSILHEFNSGSSDYQASSPDLHHILASGGYIHRIERGEMTFHQAASEEYLQKLAPMGGDAVAVLGESGEAYRFRNGTYDRIATGTEETLRAGRWNERGLGVVGGDVGTLLLGNGIDLHPVALGVEDRINAVHIASDESVLLACCDGVAMVRQGSKLLRMQAGSADLTSVTELAGTQYWGDDDHGVHVRVGDELRPAFATEYAFTMNATESLLTVNAGYSVYIYDGAGWVGLKVNPSMEALVERIEVGF